MKTAADANDEKPTGNGPGTGGTGGESTGGDGTGGAGSGEPGDRDRVTNRDEQSGGERNARRNRTDEERTASER